MKTGIWVILLVISSACTRPIAVTHWDAKGRAMVNKSMAAAKKNAWGYPKHTHFSRIVCFNKNCINRAEAINRRKKYRFKGYKNNNPPDKSIPTANDPVIAGKTQTLGKVVDKIVVNQTQTFQHVYFETGQARLNENSVDELNQLLVVLRDNSTLTIEVSGHTDNVGDEAFNVKLSEQRAKAVVDYLAQRGISRSRLSFKGYGSAKSVTANDSEAGRNQNRRVEFVLIDANQPKAE